MQTINIAAIPNQSFSIQLESNFYFIELKEANGAMVISITRNSILLIENMICVIGTPLIPYEYLEDGNFFFTTDAVNSVPYYTAFGITQFLFYITQAEIASLRAGM